MFGGESEHGTDGFITEACSEGRRMSQNVTLRAKILSEGGKHARIVESVVSGNRLLPSGPEPRFVRLWLRE